MSVPVSIASARQLYVPTALNASLPLTPALALIASTALIVLFCIITTIRRLNKHPSARPIQGDKKPATLAQEELGPLPQASKPAPPTTTTMDLSKLPLFTLRPTPHTGASPTVALAQGRYTGVLLPAGADTGLPRAVEAWRGIPYGQPTDGPRRFRPPVPLEADFEVEVKSAATFGAICPGSMSLRLGGIAQGEDCLNLNVYRRAADGKGGKGLMPVLVYVHGGAFNGGMGVERNMSSFVGWAEAPVLGVNFNYRVGALGFPSSAAADGEGCLNLGLRDQRLLFAWVRENIAAFGGDPGRVTVMGLSAGAHSVRFLCFLFWS